MQYKRRHLFSKIYRSKGEPAVNSLFFKRIVTCSLFCVCSACTTEHTGLYDHVDCSGAQQCFDKGFRLAKSGNKDDGLVYFKKACSLDHLESCKNLAVYYSLRYFTDPNDDDTDNENLKKAAIFTDRTCKLGDADICAIAGSIMMFTGDQESAQNYTHRGCSLGSKKSCSLEKLVEMVPVFGSPEVIREIMRSIYRKLFADE